MRSTKMMLGLVAILGLAACGEESPVELGDLLPGGGIRTAEVVFDGSAFLEWDSVRTGFMRPRDVNFFLVAKDYEENLDASSLLRFVPLPRTITYMDSEGKLVVDTVPARINGRLVLTMDTLKTRSSTMDPIQVSLYNVGEDWDLSSANWTMRIDSGAVKQPWAEPGGTKLRLIHTAEMLPGDSAVQFLVDSTALSLLADTTIQSRGLLIRSETSGTMIEFKTAKLHFNTRPAARDTVLTDSVQLSTKTFLLSKAADPSLDPLAPLYIGGTPGSRSYLRFKDGIDTLQVPCPDGPSGCMLRLRDVAINYAGLALRPVLATPGFNLPDTISIEPRTVLPIEGVPLGRTPLGIQLSGGVRIPPVSALEPGARVEVPITMLMTAMAATNDTTRANAPRAISLLGSPEGARFGVTAFGSLASGPAFVPRLRLIYSVTKEVQVQ